MKPVGTSKFVYLLFQSLLLIASCGRDEGTDCGPDPGDTYKLLTTEEKSKVPYTGNETLVFTSNKGDTVTLRGQGKQTNFECENNQGAGGDCPGKGRTCYESYNIGFVSTNESKLQIYRLSHFSKLPDVLSTNVIYVNVNGVTFSTFSDYINNPSSKYFSSEVIINGTNYFNVTKAFYSLQDTTQFLYLNQPHGIIGICLKSIVWNKKIN